ncbi:MAG: CheR family methyltransferase [Myxococcota bacterium]
MSVRVPIVVGVGASAGGLEALRELFLDVPSSTPLSFVVIQHLSPDHRSMMVELLTRHTRLEVRVAEDGAEPTRGCVHLIQPQTLLRLDDRGKLAVEELDSRSNLRPIDEFMASLAQHGRGPVGGIILSGTGSDGASGLAAIRKAGGVTAVQMPETAAFDGMPRAALRSHEAHVVSAPASLVREVADILSHEGPLPVITPDGSQAGGAFGRIFKQVHAHSGIDFSLYKPTTVIRRIDRRMTTLNLVQPADYAARLENDEEEVKTLTDELLINVTQFARDVGSLDALREHVVPRLVERAHIEPLRIWVAGCATGEEAYTIAMLVQDALDHARIPSPFRLFATDVSASALQVASKGEYPRAIAQHVPSDWLQKFFVAKDDHTYAVRKTIRESVIFSAHNLVADPPFTRLDLVTCRNLLIYLRVSAQEQALRSISAGLQDGGILWLGSSETVGAMDSDFEILNRHWKLYLARARRERRLGPLVTRTPRYTAPVKRPSMVRPDDRVTKGLTIAMKGYVPPMLLVDDEFRLIHRVGDVGALLSVPQGNFSRDVRDMLPRELSALMTAARARSREAGGEDIIYPHVHLELKGEAHHFDVRLRHIKDARSDDAMYAVFFEGFSRGPAAAGLKVEMNALPVEIQSQLEAYDRELRDTRENLQATIEELESSNEELQSTNEELLASNEELQSANEELQSLNEELHTVNTEHQDRMIELTELTGDLNSVLGSINAGVMVVSEDMVVRQFNDSATRYFNLLPRDVGRPLDHISHRLEADDLVASCHHVSQTAKSETRTTESNDKTVLLQITPRFKEGTPAGVVVVVTDISRFARADRDARAASAALDLAAAPTCVLTPEGEIISANASFAKQSGRDARFVVGHDFRDFHPEHEREHLTQALANAARGRRWAGIARASRPDGSEYWEDIDLIPMPRDEGIIPAIIRLSTFVGDDDVGDGEESPPDAFFLWRTESNQIHGSPGLGSLFGLTDWTGGSLDELVAHIAEEDRSGLRRQAREAGENGQPFETRCRLLDAFAHDTEVVIRMQPIPHGPGDQLVLVGKCRRTTAEPRA